MKYDDLIKKVKPVVRSVSWFDRLEAGTQADLEKIRTRWRSDESRPTASQLGRAILEQLIEAGYDGLPKVRQITDWLKGIQRA